jgi:hypothetical protein
MLGLTNPCRPNGGQDRQQSMISSGRQSAMASAGAMQPGQLHSVYRPHILRRNLPLSSGSSSSARPAHEVTHTVATQHITALQQVANTIAMVNQFRQQRQNQREVPPDQLGPPQAPQLVAPQHLPAPLPTQQPAPQPAPQPAAAADVVPFIFGGSDDACSTCAEQFHHGEQVCRLVCRHLFHAECWGNYLTATNATHGLRADRPNCRCAGTLFPFGHSLENTCLHKKSDHLSRRPISLNLGLRSLT